MIAFAAAGASVFPFLTGMPTVTAVYRLPTGLALAPGRVMPVYDMAELGRSLRSGQAQAEPGKGILLSRYDGRTDAAGRVPVLLPASIRTLWVLATDDERAELRAAGRAFATAIGGAVEAAATSDAFARDYLPRFQTIVGAAAREALSAPPTQVALKSVMRIANPHLSRVAAEDLQPALLRRLTPAVWEVVRNNTLNLVDIFSPDYRFDMGPVSAAISGAIADPKVQSGLSSAVADIAATPEAKLLAERFLIEATRRMRDDPRLGDVLSQLMADARFSAYLGPVGGPATELIRAVPRTLARLDDRADLNSLAADIFKTQARGWSGHVVIYMTPEHIRAVETVDPTIVLPLTQESRG